MIFSPYYIIFILHNIASFNKYYTDFLSILKRAIKTVNNDGAVAAKITKTKLLVIAAASKDKPKMKTVNKI